MAGRLDLAEWAEGCRPARALVPAAVPSVDGVIPRVDLASEAGEQAEAA